MILSSDYKNNEMSGRVAILFLVLFLMSLLANAYDGKSLTPPSSQVPSELEGVGIDQKLGASIDKSLKFKDENGQEVTLGSFYGTHKPVIISLVYYTCPSLCNFHLNGLTEVLKSVDWNPGQQFEVVAISFDPKETPTDAKSKKESYMSMYNRPGTEAGWHFLTGTQEEIAKITSSVGFNYKWNDKDNQWAHASAAIITTPDGVISRYLGGIQFDPKDVRLALNEASGGKIGNLIDKVILYCFHYDPKANKYALYAFNLMRLGGAVIILVMIIWLLPFWIKTKKNEGTDS